jgi:hypothetical protein
MKQKREPIIEKHLREKGLEMKELRMNEVSDQSDSEILQESAMYHCTIR